MSNVTSLARVPAATNIEPTNMGELVQLADAAAKSGFYGCKTREQALLVMMTGRDMGLSFSQSLRAFHIIQGKATLSADGAVATCVSRRDLCVYFRTIEATDERATVETQRTGDPARRYTFTAEDAKRANLWGKDNWRTYPSRMLLARARAALARDVFPDLLLGLYDPDELEPAPPTPRNDRPAPIEGEVVPRASSDAADTYRADMARCAREGSEAEARAIMAAVAKSALSPPARASLREDAAAMMASVRARAAMPSTPDVHGDPEPTGDREPGEEG